jgi:hypothetical protein
MLALQSAVKAQGELIAKLKADNADKQTIGVAVDQLKKLKTEVMLVFATCILNLNIFYLKLM